MKMHLCTLLWTCVRTFASQFETSCSLRLSDNNCPRVIVLNISEWIWHKTYISGFIRAFCLISKMISFLPHIISLYNSFINIKYNRFSMAHKLKITILSFHKSSYRLIMQCQMFYISFKFPFLIELIFQSVIWWSLRSVFVIYTTPLQNR